MGDSHIKSNLKGKLGTETISNFASISGTAIVGALTGSVSGDVTGDVSGDVTGNLIPATGRVITGGVLTIEASIVAAATALGGAQGSLYLGPSLWLLDGATTATKLAIT